MEIQQFGESWMAGLESIHHACEQAPADTGAELIRLLHDVVSMAPAELRAAIGEPISKSRLEELLEINADESAAAQMIQGGFGYMVSRSPTGTSMVTIASEDWQAEHTFSASSILVAFAGALSELIVNVSAKIEAKRGVRSSGRLN